MTSVKWVKTFPTKLRFGFHHALWDHRQSGGERVLCRLLTIRSFRLGMADDYNSLYET